MEWLLLTAVLVFVPAFILQALFKQANIEPKQDKGSARCRLRCLSSADRESLARILPGEQLGDHHSTVTVKLSDLNRVLKVLGLRLIGTFRLEGSQELEVVCYRPAEYSAVLSAYKVTASAPLGVNTKAVLSKVRDLLLPVVGKNIVVHPGGSRIEQFASGEDFHLILFSSASKEPLVDAPPAIWGVPLQGSGQAYRPTGAGTPFVDEDTGFHVGEQIDNCLYLHADVLHRLSHGGRRFSWWTRLCGRIWPLWGEDRNLALFVRVLQEFAAQRDAASFLGSIVKPGRAPANFKINFAQWQRGRQDVVRLLVGGLVAPVVQSDIVIVDAGGHAKIAAATGAFHIFLYSCAAGRPLLDSPRELWGLTFPARDKCFAPSALGVPIVDETGFVVAELLNRSLYILHPGCGFATRSEAAILAKTLKRAADLLPGFASMTLAELNQAVAEQYLQQCQRQLGQSDVLPKVDGAILQSRYEIALRNALEAEEQRRFASAGDSFGKEYDAIMMNPKVKGVRVEGAYLRVSTRMIYCREPHSGEIYEIGEFEILIPMDASRSVLWKNQTRTVNGFNAPHVNEQGLACLGNMKSVFPTLIQDKAYGAVIEAAIAFVEAVNIDDNWGRHIVRWPTAKGTIEQAAGRNL